MAAAFFHSHPDAAGAARDLTRALGAALLLARERVAQAAARGWRRRFGLIGSVPDIRNFKLEPAGTYRAGKVQ